MRFEERPEPTNHQIVGSLRLRLRPLALPRRRPMGITKDDGISVLSAKQMGAERIIAMSRHENRQKLALEFGATDIVTERGDEDATKIKELTNGLGAHSVIEAVGTQESIMQAIHATRPGGTSDSRVCSTM